MRIGVTVPMTRQRDTDELPTWAEIRHFAEYAESLGFQSLWVFDHLYNGHGDETPTEIHEAWSILTALAAVTSRVELGQLVTCASFRNPGLLAKMATTVDEISSARLTLGLGAGWYDREYHDFGYPIDHRASRFAESLDIILPLLRGETVTLDGRFHQARDAVLVPTPSRRIPVLIAGQGPRMRRMVAEHADAWNTCWYAAPDERLTTRLAEMRSSLDEVSREHASLRWTVGVTATHEEDLAYAEALEGFADLGIDDLIVSTGSASLATLDRLAKLGSRWLS